MYYAPVTPAFDWTDLIIGVILLVAATATIIKIYKGSKSTFAYALLFFAVGYTATDFV